MTGHEHAGGNPPPSVDHLKPGASSARLYCGTCGLVLAQENSRETGDTVVG